MGGEGHGRSRRTRRRGVSDTTKTKRMIMKRLVRGKKNNYRLRMERNNESLLMTDGQSDRSN